MLIPVLVRHLRFHKSLDSLERKMGYVFKQRSLLQTALTHPSYRENFGTNPDHARNSLTNCGIRQPEYGDRRIHYTRKKGQIYFLLVHFYVILFHNEWQGYMRTRRQKEQTTTPPIISSWIHKTIFYQCLIIFIFKIKCKSSLSVRFSLLNRSS